MASSVTNKQGMRRRGPAPTTETVKEDLMPSVSVAFDKPIYQVGDQVVVTVKVHGVNPVRYGDMRAVASVAINGELFDAETSAVVQEGDEITFVSVHSGNQAFVQDDEEPSVFRGVAEIVD